MATHGTLDVVVHLHRFRNVDLFSRGIYMIRVSAKTKGSDRAGIPRRRRAETPPSRGRTGAGVARSALGWRRARDGRGARRGLRRGGASRTRVVTAGTRGGGCWAEKVPPRRGRRRGPCAKTGPPTRPATRTLGENGSAATRPATRWTKTVPRRPQVQLLLEADDAVDVRAAPGDPVLARQVAAAGASRRRDV